MLLCAPAVVLRRTGTPATPLSRGVARVLALRHLTQSLASVAAHRKSDASGRFVDRAGAAVDATHAASAVALAAAGHAPSAWLPDAAVATVFAVGSWRTGRPTTR